MARNGRRAAVYRHSQWNMFGETQAAILVISTVVNLPCVQNLKGPYFAERPHADALIELTDSILTAGVVPSPAHVSLEAVHRRG